MGVKTKGRRKIVVNDTQYIWYVSDNYDGCGFVLNILSQDKKFIVKYQLSQPNGEEYLVVLGSRFAGADTGGSWCRFLCPKWGGENITPKDVRNIIEWCLDESIPRQKTTCKGGI